MPTPKYDIPYKPRKKESTKAMQELKQFVVDKDIPEFPPTKHYFEIKRSRKSNPKSRTKPKPKSKPKK